MIGIGETLPNFRLQACVSIEPNVHEVLRTLSALQTNELTPCNWVPGEATLTRGDAP